MKKFFVYELKKSLFVMCALTVIATAVYLISVLSFADDIVLYGYRRLQAIESMIVVAAMLSVIIPVWKLSYLMKKRSVDLYYALPLSHTRILAVKFTVGLIVLFASFTVAFWIGSIATMTVAGKLLKCVYFIPLYFSLLVPMAVIYALTAFLFTRANRFIDGIMFVIMTGMSLAVVADVILNFIGYGVNDGNVYEYYFRSYNYSPFGTLGLISNYFEGNMFKNISSRVVLTEWDWVGFSLVTALGIAAGVGLFFAERKAKSENCEQISESYFGYKVMIPLYAFCWAATIASDSYFLAVLVAVAAYAVSVLYKRTPKIGWQFALIVGVSYVLGAGLSFIP